MIGDEGRFPYYEGFDCESVPGYHCLKFFKSDRLKPRRGISGCVHRYLYDRKFRGALFFILYLRGFYVSIALDFCSVWFARRSTEKNVVSTICVGIGILHGGIS